MACILQERHPLKPFRNKGFHWFSQFEELLPVSGATGSNTFTLSTVPSLSSLFIPPPSSSSIPPPSSSVPPTSSSQATPASSGFAVPVQPHGSDWGSAVTASSTMHITTIRNGDKMDIDTAIGLSISAGKCKHSDIMLHGDDNGHTHDDSDRSFPLNIAPLSNSQSSCTLCPLLPPHPLYHLHPLSAFIIL